MGFREVYENMMDEELLERYKEFYGYDLAVRPIMLSELLKRELISQKEYDEKLKIKIEEEKLNVDLPKKSKKTKEKTIFKINWKDYMYVSLTMFLMEIILTIPVRVFIKRGLGLKNFHLYIIFSIFILFIIRAVGGIIYTKRFDEISYPDVSALILAGMLGKLENSTQSLLIAFVISLAFFRVGIEIGYKYFKKKVTS